MSAKKKVQKQMEFYLSASNLRQDKFLQQQMDEEGFISMEVFLTFNRMKSLGVTKRLLLEAVQKSPLLVLNDTQTHVRPKDLPDDANDDSIDRTMYIENFPSGSDHDSLRRLFTPFGKVNLVSMPRFPGSQKFKGFAFVEFASAETVAVVVAAVKAKDMEQTPALVGIKGMPKVKWVQLRDSLKERIHHTTPQNTSGTLKQAVETAASSTTDFFTRGLLIRLSNVPADTMRKDLKAALEQAAPVAFLDDSKLKFGGSVAFARFLSTSHTQRVVQYFQTTPLRLKDMEIAIDVVDGDDEVSYWTTLVNQASATASAAPKLATDNTKPTRPVVAYARDATHSSATTTHIHFGDDAAADDANNDPPRAAKRTKLH
ncbi:Aste57867_23269 [Aphanomyces stellatus]|uniref:Aste57867_23269 protein n=1 Tax=Aphanomyces stellatus TaxID=120398 RepID=A0A485LRW7_9STRA|nr:hypothetical protein As57867_023198 [Aphanomyces stellatus]VFT99914.1 Aste57867_23269 [Aphanomyces stellatus]